MSNMGHLRIGIALVVLSVGTAWFLQRRILRRGRHVTVSGKGHRITRIRLGAWRWPARVFLLGYVFVAAVMPAIALLLVTLNGFWTPNINWGALDFDAFQRVLSWCNRQDPDLDFRVARVLDSGTHGWMELVAQEPCADIAAARRFYRRAGRLLGLLHVLGASDCHRENLIANGEHPVLVDAEVLLGPEAAQRGEGHSATEDLEGHRQLWTSVLGTGLPDREREPAA